MGDKWEKKKRTMLALTAMSVSAFSLQTFASENMDFPPVTLESDIISIDLPILTEEVQPFDFFLDPEGLLYETDAMIYSGGIVEAGATLLFHNTEGDYDFSRHSDYLDIKNKSTFPVNVTITARITDLGEIDLKETDDFLDSESASMYLALTDSEGNIQPLSVEREVSITVQMLPASETFSSDNLDENSQIFQDSMTESVYSFGLTGACNPRANWLNVEVHPVVTVTWFTEPVQQEMLSEGDSVDVQGGDVSMSDSMEGDKDDSITESEGITDCEGGNNVTSDSTKGCVSDGDAKSQNTAGQEVENAAEPDSGAGDSPEPHHPV